MVRNELLDEILNLDAADRQYVRDVVLASLSKEMPPQLSPEDQQMVLRRAGEFEKNPESFESWDQVKAKLAKQRAGQAP